MADMTDRALLLQPFHPASYEYDDRGNVYISGLVIEQRLDRATNGLWTLSSIQVADRPISASGGKAVCDVTCSLWLDLPSLGTRPGYGQMTLYGGADWADAAKGATTAAIRSAANRFGVGREIWPLLTADHWLHWLSMVTRADQAETAQRLLKATFAWLGCRSASRDHKDAWNECHEEVQGAVDATVRRVSDGRATERDEAPAAPLTDVDAPADHSDAATMRRLCAKYGDALKATDADEATALGREAARAFEAAVRAGKVRKGGACEQQLDDLHTRTVAHARALREREEEPADEAAEPTPAEVAGGLVELFDAAADASELEVAYQAQLAAEQADQLTAEGRAAVDEAAARAAERVGELAREEAA